MAGAVVLGLKSPRHHRAGYGKAGKSGQRTSVQLTHRSTHGQRRIRRGQRIGNERANLLSHDPETLLSFMPTLESVRFLYKNAQVFEQLDCGAAPGWTPGCRSRACCC